MFEVNIFKECLIIKGKYVPSPECNHIKVSFFTFYKFFNEILEIVPGDCPEICPLLELSPPEVPTPGLSPPPSPRSPSWLYSSSSSSS